MNPLDSETENELDPFLNLALPPEGFFREYLKYASKLTDAPDIFHVAGALTAAASVVGPRIRIPTFGGRATPPNLYCLLIAPSSTFHKSTALNISRDLVKLVDEEAILPDDSSPEAFFARLAKRGDGILYQSEFAKLLASFGRKYMEGFQEGLTDLFDGPPNHNIDRKSGQYRISQPCVNILGASNETWFEKWLKPGDIYGGFLARFIFFVAREKKRQMVIPPPWIEEDTILKEQRDSLINALTEMRRASEANGRVSMDGCEDQFIVGAEEINSRLEGSDRRDLLSVFFTRGETYAKKFAVLYELSTTGSPNPSRQSMGQANVLVQILLNAIEGLLDTGIGQGEEAKDRQTILKHAIRHNSISRRALQQYAASKGISRYRWKNAWGGLNDEGRLEEDSNGRIHVIPVIPMLCDK